jgi:hypothetical protein
MLWKAQPSTHDRVPKEQAYDISALELADELLAAAAAAKLALISTGLLAVHVN